MKEKGEIEPILKTRIFLFLICVLIILVANETIPSGQQPIPESSDSTIIVDKLNK